MYTMGAAESQPAEPVALEGVVKPKKEEVKAVVGNIGSKNKPKPEQATLALKKMTEEKEPASEKDLEIALRLSAATFEHLRMLVDTGKMEEAKYRHILATVVMGKEKKSKGTPITAVKEGYREYYEPMGFNLKY